MGRIGYARVSTTDQDLAEQVAQLEAAGCSIIRSEAASGVSRDGRDELATILAFIKPGDELVVQRIDRLGRSTRDVLNIVHELDAKGASLRVLDPEVTTAGEIGRMVITILGMVAGMELRFIKGRQKAGIAAARARGVYKGGAKKIDDNAIRALLAQGVGKAEAARQLGISRMSVYRALETQPTDAGKATSAPTPSVAPPPVPLPGHKPVPPSVPSITPVATPPPGPDTVSFTLSLEVEINRKGTRGRKRAIADIEEELAWQGTLDDDPPIDGDYAITIDIDPDDHAHARQFRDGDALDHVVEDLIRNLGRIADRRYCYVKATVLEPATGRNWFHVEPDKALRRRRSPGRKRAPAHRRRKSKPITMLDPWGVMLNYAYPAGQPHVIRKGEGGNALYYLDANDQQTAWHADIAKARRFASYDSALDVLDLLLEGNILTNETDDYDILPL